MNEIFRFGVVRGTENGKYPLAETEEAANLRFVFGFFQKPMQMKINLIFKVS